MRAILQRVSQAHVSVDGSIVGQIQQGIVVLLGIALDDTPMRADWLAEKIVSLRLFPDQEGKMNISLVDIQGQLLVISQFTLYGECQKGRRPSFTKAASPEIAEPLYQYFLDACRMLGIQTEAGIFGASMQVSLVNDGPVTLILDTP
ncbi:MAG: D-tyrosyl-tRNA(Tyr) deacylase [Planctomycetia bacterium]|nr:D-tyrosyl-tRNA(Tyr) deacylase [Planctomycetia bacterium]